MSFWGQLNLQEASAVIMELINYFHDYMVIILVLILSFVTYLFIYLIINPYLDKYTMDSHLLETVWTIIPMVILLFIAFPSLYLLYLIEGSTFLIKFCGLYPVFENCVLKLWSYDFNMVISDRGCL